MTIDMINCISFKFIITFYYNVITFCNISPFQVIKILYHTRPDFFTPDPKKSEESSQSLTALWIEDFRTNCCSRLVVGRFNISCVAPFLGFRLPPRIVPEASGNLSLHSISKTPLERC